MFQGEREADYRSAAHEIVSTLDACKIIETREPPLFIFDASNIKKCETWGERRAAWIMSFSSRALFV